MMELRPAVVPEDLPAVSRSVSQVYMHRTSASTSHSGDAHPWLTSLLTLLAASENVSFVSTQHPQLPRLYTKAPNHAINQTPKTEKKV